MTMNVMGVIVVGRIHSGENKGDETHGYKLTKWS